MASRDIFVDTSGFYALMAKRDSAHGKAAQIIKDAQESRRGFVTTDAVLSETATLLKARKLGHLAAEFFALCEKSRILRIERVDESRFDLAKTLFLKHLDKEYSFTDCASFVVMKELGLSDALTTDHHFRAAGFVALLLE